MIYGSHPFESCPGCGKPALRTLHLCVLFASTSVDDIGYSEYLKFPESELEPADLAFCNWCVVSFDPTEPEPTAHRHDGYWSEVPWPTEPAYATLAALWERVAESGIGAVVTEKTLLGLLPEGIVHNRWWESATGLTVVTGDGQAEILERYSDCYLLETHSDGFSPGWIRSIQHKSSLLDPVGVLGVATPDGADTFVPEGDSPDPELLDWRPTRPHRPELPKPVIQLEQEIDDLLGSLAADADEPTPDSERMAVIWGEPHMVFFMLESRARMLAEAWTALHEHGVWMEAEKAVAPATAEWLADTLERFLGEFEYGELAPSTALSLFTKEAAENPDLWPYPNSEDEFDLFVDGLSEAGKEIIFEALDDEMVRWLPTTLDGLVVSIDDPEGLARLLAAAGIDCRRDDELIRAALGTWT